MPMTLDEHKELLRDVDRTYLRMLGREQSDADNTPHEFAPSERDAGTCRRCGNGPDFKTHSRNV